MSESPQWYERHLKVGIGSGKGFQQTIQDALHGFSRGSMPHSSNTLWDDIRTSAITFFSNMVVENPILAVVCLFVLATVFATWYAWQYLPSFLECLIQWLKSRAMASVTLEDEDEDLLESVKSYALLHGIFGDAKHTTAQSATWARNSTQKVIPEKESIVFESNHNTQVFRHKTRLFMLTRESDDTNTKLWTFSRTAKPIRDMLREIYVEQTQEKSLHEITVYCAETTRSYSRPTLEWVRQPRTDRRTMESVCLPSDIKTKLVKNIERFLHELAPA